jgi:SAM-dependent methyltransferase
MRGRDLGVAGGAQAYLRDVQYRDSSRLAARARLHVKYGTAPVAWFPWLATQVGWPGAARVLEVGCGAGWMWAEAAARLPEDIDLTLTDISPGMVDEAVERVGSLGRYGRTTGRVADVQDLPFRDAAFDVVVANYVLHHVPDAPRAVAEMARVLRPEGTLVVACVGDGHLTELHQIRREVFGDVAAEAFRSSFGATSGAQVLPGWFGEVRWQPYRDDLDCRDPDDVLDYLSSTPPVEGASDADRGRVVAMVQQRFAAGGGRLRVSKDTGVFVCRGPRRASTPSRPIGA